MCVRVNRTPIAFIYHIIPDPVECVCVFACLQQPDASRIAHGALALFDIDMPKTVFAAARETTRRAFMNGEHVHD